MAPIVGKFRHGASVSKQKRPNVRKCVGPLLDAATLAQGDHEGRPRDTPETVRSVGGSYGSFEGGWGSPAEAGEARGSGRASLQLATLVAAGARELAKVSEPSLPSRKLTEGRLAADEGNWLSEIKSSPAIQPEKTPHTTDGAWPGFNLADIAPLGFRAHPPTLPVAGRKS